MIDVTIIGSGPAGLTAAIYTARAGFKPVVYAGLQHGGQLTTTTEVENYPGFAHGIMGPELMAQMTSQAERVGASIEYKLITRVDLSKTPFKLWSDDLSFESKSVIIATGATAKTLNIPGEKALMGRGISTCATCDGFFYRNKEIVLIGGGDTAMEEATYLAKLCKKVTIVHRNYNFKASKVMLERARSHSNIEFKQPYVLKEALSDHTGLTGVVLTNQETQKDETIMCPGLFYAIGHTPNSELFKDFVDTDAHGYIKTTVHTQTKISGVFAAGDIADSTFRQAVTAAGLGCQAGMQAARFLEGQGGHS